MYVKNKISYKGCGCEPTYEYTSCVHVLCGGWSIRRAEIGFELPKHTIDQGSRYAPLAHCGVKGGILRR